MSQPNPTKLHGQVQNLQRHFAQLPGLPFADLLPADDVLQVLDDEQVRYRDRLYSPLVTLWMFLSQTLDPDHSCCKAVARFLSHPASQGLIPCSSNNISNIKANQH